MTAVEDRLVELLHAAVPEPPDDVPFDAVARRVRRGRVRRGAVAVVLVGGLIAGTALVVVAFGRGDDARLRAGAPAGPYPELRHFVPPRDAARPTYVSAPLRSVTLRYSVMSTTHYETVYDKNGNWIQRSVGVPTSFLSEYRDGVWTANRDGQLVSQTIDPASRPYQPSFELTRYGAAFVANQEWLENRRAKSASERVRGVRCDATTQCVEVIYTRRGRVGDDAEESTLVYDARTRLVWYFRLRLNGNMTHEFKMEDVRTEAPSATTTTAAALATTSTRPTDLVYRALPETVGPRATIAGGSGGAPPCAPRPTDGTYGADTAHPQRAPLQQLAVFAGGIRWAICGASTVNSADVLNLRSTDHGRTWTVSDTGLRFSPHHAGDQLAITLDSPMVGQIHIRSEVGLFDGTYATTDGGQTWRLT